MRQILKSARDNPRNLRADPVTVAAPIGGWDTKSPLALMDPQNAVDLVNWYPRESYLELRAGMAPYCTTPAEVQTLIPTVIGASARLLAATQSTIYDVTGGVLTTLASGFLSGVWHFAAFQSGVGVSAIVMANGTDLVQVYNGATVSAGAYTGVPSTNVLRFVTAHQRRVWFGHNSNLTLYYTAVDAITGALTAFDMSSIFKKGGRFAFLETWSIDTGSGSDDYLVIGTTEGEVAVYAGTNPAASATWQLRSVYSLPRPVGEKPATRFGGDVAIMTESGVFPMSSVTQSVAIDRRISITDNVNRAFVAATASFKNLPGWCGCYFPQQTMLLFNVPSTSTTFEQYVMNVASGAWCRFNNWNGRSIAEWQGELFIGTPSGVRRIWSGTDDLGANISAYAAPAYNYFQKPGVKKFITEMKPLFLANAQFQFSFRVENDFYAQNPTAILPATSGGAAARWDVALWDSAVWASGNEALRPWVQPAHYPSNALGLVIAIDVRGVSIQWISTDFVIMETGII